MHRLKLQVLKKITRELKKKKSPESLLIFQYLYTFLGSIFREADIAGCRWDPGIHILKKTPGDSNTDKAAVKNRLRESLAWWEIRKGNNSKKGRQEFPRDARVLELTELLYAKR